MIPVVPKRRRGCPHLVCLVSRTATHSSVPHPSFILGAPATPKSAPKKYRSAKMHPHRPLSRSPTRCALCFMVSTRDLQIKALQTSTATVKADFSHTLWFFERQTDRLMGENDQLKRKVARLEGDVANDYGKVCAVFRAFPST